MLVRILALASAVAAWSPGMAPLSRNAHMRHSMTPLMVDQFRWSTAKTAVAGDKADVAAAPSDITWAKAAWESIGKEGAMHRANSGRHTPETEQPLPSIHHSLTDIFLFPPARAQLPTRCRPSAT
jgi:hypothetical protein